MRIKIIAALAATTLSVSPVLAQVQNVQSVSVTDVSRSGANSGQASELEGGSSAILGILAAAVAAIFVVIAATNEDDIPTSP